MVAMKLLVLLPVLLGLLKCVEGYLNQGVFPPSRHASSLFSSIPSSMDEPNTDIIKLCEAGDYDEALTSLEQLPLDNGFKSSSIQILKSLVDRQRQVHEERALAPKETDSQVDYMAHLNQADQLVQKLLELGESSESDVLLPEAEVFNDLIKMWGSSTFAEEASVRCQSYLDLLWSLYDDKKDERFVPLYESYDNAVSACSARDRGLDGAKRAESLMKDMESRSKDHPELRPNRSIANGVM